MGERRPWEKSYPAGVRWDAPIERATLPALFDAFTEKWAAKPALEYRDRQTSYAELRATVDAIASGLMDLGVKPGTSVALYLPNTPYHPFAFFAVLKCGGRVVHLSPLDAERELAFKLKDSGARILVTTNIGFMGLLAQKLKADGLVDHLIVGDDRAFGPSNIPTAPIADDAPILRLEKLREEGALKLPRQWPMVAVDDIALLQYTGGTTGKPKGAMLTHGNLIAACSIYKLWSDPQRMLPARRGQGHLRAAAVPHLRADLRDAALPVRGQRAAPARALRRGDDAARHRGEEGDRLPRRADHVDRARQHAGHREARFLLAALCRLGRCRAAGGGGGAVPEADRPAHRRRLGHDGDFARRHGHAARVDGQGRLRAGCRCPASRWTSSRSTTGAACSSPASRARSASRGPTSRRATGTRPRKRPAAFVDGCLLTGDIGTMDEDGYFYLVDRKKDMIISGGFNVYPRTIEEAIYEHPSVDEVSRHRRAGRLSRRDGEGVRLHLGADRFTLDELRAFLADAPP